MEGIHGVDVSWLHHSHKDHHSNATPVSTAPSTPSSAPDDQPQVKDGSSLLEANGATTSPNHTHLHRPHLHNNASSERPVPPVHPSSKNVKDMRPAPLTSPGRRNSWISNISSKFSSAPSPPPVAGRPVSARPVSPQETKPPISPGLESPNPFAAAVPQGVKEVKKSELSASQPQQSPKSGHPSFLSSAFRRLSSSGNTTMGKAASTGEACPCPRRVMNIDPYRERCSIPDLEVAKLRRVAFSVDVEIAAPARYTEEEAEEPEEPPPPQPERRASLTQIEKRIDVKKKKDQKLKKGEGEALKNPRNVAAEKEQNGVVKTSGEVLDHEMVSKSLEPLTEEVKDPRRKEKKKRSEEERKERKERKRQEALTNGSVPVEVVGDGSSSSSIAGSPNDSETHLKSQNRPTTDPLRIYKRCSQLRETPVLKRIADQLSSPSACLIATPGIISCLDLSGYCMELPEIVTLGDYLAVVPVKKLMMEDCGLGDEAVRVILAGLLAAKTPEQAKYNKHLAKKACGQAKGGSERLGVIEKLSLKNNPKIGRDGWRHITLFLNMSKSIKAIDLSMIPFPQPSAASSSHSLLRISTNSKSSTDISSVLQTALSERLGGGSLEELVMAECGFTTDNIENIVDGAINCGLKRLGLASNSITPEGLQIVTRYVQNGVCEGLDLGGNDFHDSLHILAEVLHDQNSLYALSLADCNLSPPSLEPLLPALVRLPNFRFIDLSHNRDLFATQPNALNLLRKYLPQLPVLKRVHLADVSMSPEHAIALAEVLPESPHLAHLNILENPQLTALASAQDETGQEEACALYASLMAAVRVSSSLICIDIDVPSQDSSDVVKALAKQVVAYSLRNMERGAVPEVDELTATGTTDPSHPDKHFSVPDILLHLVGHVEDYPENHDNDEAAPDDDYIVGGTGVVKALGICLGNNAADYRRPSRDTTPSNSGTATPKQIIQGAEMRKGKAKEMSKNLLGSARKIRARLQPALVREAKNGDEMSYRRLQFLDSTLERMIQRFEDEYPECRLVPKVPTSSYGDEVSPFKDTFLADVPKPEGTVATIEGDNAEEEDEEAIHMPNPRHNSDVSLASRYLAQEEGRMHRVGQQLRRDILLPQSLDYAHGTTGQEDETQHLRKIREKLESLNGKEIQETVEQSGVEALLEAIGASADDLIELEKQDPAGFEKFREAQMAAQINVGRYNGGYDRGTT